MNDPISIFELGMDRQVTRPIAFPAGTVLNLGAGKKLIPGTVPLDLSSWNAEHQPIPYPDGSVAGIHAYHFLEHIQNIIPLLAEIQRVLITGGAINIVVPYYNSQCMAQDLNHHHAFCEDTWRNLFQNPYYVNSQGQTWQLEIRFNMIMALVERNMVLVTQLVKL